MLWVAPKSPDQPFFLLISYSEYLCLQKNSVYVFLSRSIAVVKGLVKGMRFVYTENVSNKRINYAKKRVGNPSTSQEKKEKDGKSSGQRMDVSDGCP